MSRCCCGGIPSFSSTRSLIRSTLSVGSMSISISFPVSVWNRQAFHESYSPIHSLFPRWNILSGSLGIYYVLRDEQFWQSFSEESKGFDHTWIHRTFLGCEHVWARFCERFDLNPTGHFTLPHPTPLESMRILVLFCLRQQWEVS